MTRFALTLEYDGAPFFGLQRQLNGPSIQGAIEDAVFAITGERTNLVAAGRTDAGVHASAMRAHIDIAKDITPFRLMEAINAVIRPAPIAVLDCAVVPGNWHARFSCTGRSYVYHIAVRRAPLTLEAGRAWHVKHQLDVRAMDDAAQVLVGTHDFTTFRSVHCQSKSPVKAVDRLDVISTTGPFGGEILLVETAARSYLHHQVRSMVGCLALVGLGRWSKDDLAAALAARDRTKLGLNAPAHGLYFTGAQYPDQEQKQETDQ